MEEELEESTDEDLVLELLDRDLWVIEQIHEWPETILGFEGANKYQILDENANLLGYVAEVTRGFWDMMIRIFMKSHRPFQAVVFNADGEQVMEFSRPFFWFFSSLYVTAGDSPLGEVHRRFALFRKKYNLIDFENTGFAKIFAGIFRIWTFDVLSAEEEKVGTITKKWGGLLKECFTDADRFLVQLEGPGLEFTLEQRAVLLGTAISIDFDFFEDNQKNQGLLGG